jgi:DNA repair protein RecN (Recombination protein N)
MSLQRRQTEKTELLEFQKNEIELAAVEPDEDSELEQERQRLKNAEALYEAVHTSLDSLYVAPGSIFENLVQIRKDMDKAARIDATLEEKTTSIAEAIFQIEDGVEGLRSYLRTVQYDDKRLEEIDDRLHTLNQLKRKYGGSLEAVAETFDSIIAELKGIDNLSVKIESVEKRLSDLQTTMAKQAMQLSKKRKQTATDLARKVVGELETLKMAKSEFKVFLRSETAGDDANAYLVANNRVVYETGIDRATFMIAPNVGETLKPLAAIASGGELSRVVLALKSILAATESVETVVFDEVDAGIGGGVAEVVGRKLADLSSHHQIICITHLPQIAKFGDHHFSISKQVADGRTRTVIQSLDTEERYAEIARMLGGEEITAATMNHARELLQK